MKNLLVELDESAATKTTADRERWFADLLETHRRRSDETRSPHRLWPPPAKVATTPSNYSHNFANNPNQSISVIMKGERSSSDE